MTEHSSGIDGTIHSLVAVSVDAQRLNDLVFDINSLWSAPLCIGVSIFFLWQLLGVSVFAGLGVLILTIPSNVLLARRSKVIQVSLEFRCGNANLLPVCQQLIKFAKLVASTNEDDC